MNVFKYAKNMNQRDTLKTEVNVLANFNPVVPENYRSPNVVVLGNLDPIIQLKVMEQIINPPTITILDTMNFWIGGKQEELWKVLEKVDVLVINDGEARELGQDSNLVKVAQDILARGPKHLIVKRGEYGVLMFNGKQTFGAPAFPLEMVKDPTGAGDTFAGGFMGHLAATKDFSDAGMRRAIIFGSVMASFNVEAFSLDRLRDLDYKEVEARFREFKRLTHFEDLSL